MSVKKTEKIFFLSLLLFSSLGAKKFTIMISPEGDSTNSGRSLQEGYECGFTRQCAELLKESLEQNSDIRVIMSHESGEHIAQHEKASFSNRLEIDMYLSLNVYAADKPSMQIYTYQSSLFNQPTSHTRLELLPTTKAYIINLEKTHRYTAFWQPTDSLKTIIHFTKPIALPIKQLEGIIAPAFALELSAQKIIDLHAYITPISEILTKVAHAQNN